MEILCHLLSAVLLLSVLQCDSLPTTHSLDISTFPRNTMIAIETYSLPTETIESTVSINTPAETIILPTETTTLATETTTSMVNNRSCALTNYKEYIKYGRNCTVDCVNGEERIFCPHKECKLLPALENSRINVTKHCDEFYERYIYFHNIECSPGSIPVSNDHQDCIVDCHLGFERSICSYTRCTPRTYIADNGQECIVTCDEVFQNITCLYERKGSSTFFTQNGYFCHRYWEGGEYKIACPKYQQELAANLSGRNNSVQNRICALTNYYLQMERFQKNCTVDCVNGEERIKCMYPKCTPSVTIDDNFNHTVECGEDFQRDTYVYNDTCFSNNYTTYIGPDCVSECHQGFERKICSNIYCTPNNYIASNGQNCTVSCDGNFEHVTCLYRECKTVNFTARGYECSRYCKGGEEIYFCPRFDEEEASRRSQNSQFFFGSISFIPDRETLFKFVERLEKNSNAYFDEYDDGRDYGDNYDNGEMSIKRDNGETSKK